MTGAEKRERVRELNSQIVKIMEGGLLCPNTPEWESAKTLKEERGNLIYELEREKKILWDDQKWVTDYRSDFIAFTGELADPIQTANEDLLDKLRRMNGVRVKWSGSGVKVISVLTRYKEYTYAIATKYGDWSAPGCWAELRPCGWSWREEFYWDD